mgnify:CR=1 FL=1
MTLAARRPIPRHVKLLELTDHDKSTAGNCCFDPEGSMYDCTGNKDVAEGKMRGTVYRV